MQPRRPLLSREWLSVHGAETQVFQVLFVWTSLQQRVSGRQENRGTGENRECIKLRSRCDDGRLFLFLTERIPFFPFFLLRAAGAEKARVRLPAALVTQVIANAIQISAGRRPFCFVLFYFACGSY